MLKDMATPNHSLQTIPNAERFARDGPYVGNVKASEIPSGADELKADMSIVTFNNEEM